jgi:hypothetical protein
MLDVSGTNLLVVAEVRKVALPAISMTTVDKSGRPPVEHFAVATSGALLVAAREK